MKGQLFDIGVNGANEYFFVTESDNISYLKTKRFEGSLGYTSAKRFEGSLGYTSESIYAYQMQRVEPNLPADVALGMKIVLSADLLSFYVQNGWMIPLQTMGIYEEISNFADSPDREIQIVNQIIADYLIKVQEEAKELFVRTIPEKKIYLDDFLMGYIEAAFFSSTYEKEENQNEGIPLDRDYGREDLEPLTLLKMMEDCKMFQQVAWSDIKDDLAEAGSDFWHTRNRHGVGFWDGDWEKEIGKKLTALSQTFSEVTLDVCEGKVYQISA